MSPLHIANCEHAEIEVDLGPIFRGLQSQQTNWRFLIQRT